MFNINIYYIMNKKYLMKGFAALALIAGFSSCVKDVDGVDPGQQEQAGKENAELQLGLTIPDGQSWDMSTQVTATVTVNGDYGANYIVNIYEQNPFINNTATILGRASVVSGGTAEFKFTCPNSVVSAFASIKDEKGYSYVKPVAIVDGKIETTFGGESAAGSRSLRAARRSAADDATIATRTAPDLSAYTTGCTELTAENNVTTTDVRKYIISAGNTFSDPIKLIQASDPNSNDIVSVYVLGTLNISTEQRINGGYGGNYVFIVGDGGVVNIAAGAKLSSNANNNANPQTTGMIHVLAGGTIQGDGTLEFSNGTNGYGYNGGTIDVGYLNNNGGTLYNAGTIEADHLLGGAGLSIYENAGKMHIGDAAKGSGTANTRIHNNCWFECDGTLSLRNIIQGEGAYIKAANLEMSGSEDGTGDVAYIWAKSNSLIDITGAAAFNNVDIIGPTGDGYAYIQLGAVEGAYGTHGLTTATNYTVSNGVMTVGAIQNNVRMSVETVNVDDNLYTESEYEKVLNMLNGERAHTSGAAYAQWGQSDADIWGWGSYTVQGNGNAVMVAKGQVNDVVTEDECSPGIEIVPPTPIYDEPIVYTYAFEDQIYNGDYDLNDVVLKVTFPVTRNSKGEVTAIDSTKLDVTMVAAGATFKIKVYVEETALFDGKEIHDAFGKYNTAAGATQPMINTGNGKAITAEPVSDQISVPSSALDSDGNVDFSKLNIWIWVNPESGATSETKIYYLTEKHWPYAVMIPNDWRWPLERICVTEAYAGTEDATDISVTVKGVATTYKENSFGAWAATEDAQRTTIMKSWFDYPVNGKTMRNE